jgi:hypothetical protein
LAVAESFKSVHPIGHPISHSTHVGFSFPPTWSANPTWGSVGFRPVSFTTVLFGSVTIALGVRHMRAAATASGSCRFIPADAFSALRRSQFCTFPVCFASPALGVGHRPNLAIAPSVGRSAAPALAERLNIEPVSTVQGVGSNKPEPVALVRGANVGSSQHCPSAVIPERGQVTEHSSESPSNEGWAVLHEREAGSNFANDPRHVLPHSAALSVNAGAFAGHADVLAREASRNHINTPAPRSSVKGANVAPDRERREKPFVLAGGKYASGVGLPLNCAHAAPPEQLAREYSATSACEKSQLIHTSPRFGTTRITPR